MGVKAHDSKSKGIGRRRRHYSGLAGGCYLAEVIGRFLILGVVSPGAEKSRITDAAKFAEERVSSKPPRFDWPHQSCFLSAQTHAPHLHNFLFPLSRRWP